MITNIFKLNYDDNIGNLIEIRRDDGAAIHISYDKQNRPVCVQDGVSREKYAYSNEYGDGTTCITVLNSMSKSYYKYIMTEAPDFNMLLREDVHKNSDWIQLIHNGHGHVTQVFNVHNMNVVMSISYNHVVGDTTNTTSPHMAQVIYDSTGNMIQFTNNTKTYWEKYEYDSDTNLPKRYSNIHGYWENIEYDEFGTLITTSYGLALIIQNDPYTDDIIAIHTSSEFGCRIRFGDPDRFKKYTTLNYTLLRRLICVHEIAYILIDVLGQNGEVTRTIPIPNTISHIPTLNKSSKINKEEKTYDI